MDWAISGVIGAATVAGVVYMHIATARSMRHAREVYALAHDLIDFVFDFRWRGGTVDDRNDWYRSLPRPHDLVSNNPFRWKHPDPKSMILGRYAEAFWRWRAERELRRLDQAEQEATS